MKFWTKIKDVLDLDYESCILVFDFEHIITKNGLVKPIQNMNFEIIDYQDVEVFRYLFESQIKKSRKNRIVVLVQEDCYVPYDVCCFFKTINLSHELLYPKLNHFILSNEKHLNYELLSLAYEELYEDKTTEAETKDFITSAIFEKENLERYQYTLVKEIDSLFEKKLNIQQWYQIAAYKAELNLIPLKVVIDMLQ